MNLLPLENIFTSSTRKDIQFKRQSKNTSATNLIKYSTIFILGLFLVDFSFWINISSSLFDLPSIVEYIIIGFILFALFQYRINKPIKFKVYGKCFKYILFIFILWSCFLVIKSFRPDLFYFQEALKAPFFLLPYFLPVIFLGTDFSKENLLRSLRWGIRLLPILAIISLSIILTLSRENWYEHYYRLQIFEFWTIPLFLISFLLKKKDRVIIWLYVFFILFLSAFYGRRSWTLDVVLIVIFYLLIKYLSDKNILKSILRTGLVIFSFLFVTIVFSKQIFSLHIFERGLDAEAFEKSRGSVFEDFLSDFSSTSDWLFGRGLNGEIKRSIDKVDGKGRGIENGYLHTILKGGNLYFILQYLIFFRAFYLGWFKSRNNLSMALASLYLIHFIGLVGFNIPSFTFRYLSLWILVPVLFKSELRSSTDKELILQLYN